MLRTVRNIAIILILAVPIAFVPGGGGIAQGVLAILLMAFLASLVAAARQIYREDRLTFDSLPDDQRAVLYGAVGRGRPDDRRGGKAARRGRPRRRDLGDADGVRGRRHHRRLDAGAQLLTRSGPGRRPALAAILAAFRHI